MSLCFLCDRKLYGERTQICSTTTPLSNVPYPEKIAELMGDEFVVIVTPNDHMCKKCTSLLTHMDKLENDLELVRNAILSYVQKKYGILPPGQAVMGIEIVDENVIVEKQLEQGQRKVPSGLRIRNSPTVTSAGIVPPVQTQIKFLKTEQYQPPQQQKQQQQQQQQKQQPPPQQKSKNKMKIYKCGFCTYQSKELGHVRFHMRSHTSTPEPEKPILVQAAEASTPVSQKKQIYRCQLCFKSFGSRINCIDHIKKEHNQLIPSTSNGEKENEGSHPVTAKNIEPEPSMIQENNAQAESAMDIDKNQLDNNQSTEKENEDSHPVTAKDIEPEPSMIQENNAQAESAMDIDENQQDNNQGTVNPDMILNDNVPTEGPADAEEKEEEEADNADKGEVTESSQEDKTVKEAELKIKPEPAQEEEEEDTAAISDKEEDTAAMSDKEEDTAAMSDKEEDTASMSDKEEDTAAMSVKDEAELETPDSVENEVDDDNTTSVENKTGDLDIESM